MVWMTPAKLLMGRKLRANLPLVTEQLRPHWNSHSRQKDKREDYDRCHRVRTLPPIPDDSEVWITFDRNQIIPGNVTGESGTPHSYNVSTSSGTQSRIATI